MLRHSTSATAVGVWGVWGGEHRTGQDTSSRQAGGAGAERGWTKRVRQGNVCVSAGQVAACAAGNQGPSRVTQP